MDTPINSNIQDDPLINQPINNLRVPQTQTKNSFFSILLTILISAIIFSLAGYYFGMQKNSLSLLNQNTQISYSPSPTISPSFTPLPTETPALSEIGNTEMKNATKVVSNDNKYQVWLDGKNFDAIQLWVSNINDSQKKLLVSGTYNYVSTKVGDYSLLSPVWSPNGTQIAYLRSIINRISELDVTSKLDLYIINQDGTNDHLVKSDIFTPIGYYLKTDLQWNSDGISYTDSSTVSGTKVTIQPK